MTSTVRVIENRPTEKHNRIVYYGYFKNIIQLDYNLAKANFSYKDISFILQHKGLCFDKRQEIFILVCSDRTIQNIIIKDN